VATFPAGTTLPDEFREIGRVSAREGPEAPAVTVDGAAYEGSPGHTHF
jgi:thiamine-monophosphate kinase